MKTSFGNILTSLQLDLYWPSISSYDELIDVINTKAYSLYNLVGQSIGL